LTLDDPARVRAAFEARRDEVTRAWKATVRPARVRALRAGAGLALLVGLLLLVRPRVDRALGIAILAFATTALADLTLGPTVSVEWKRALPAHVALAVAPLAVALVLLRADRERGARALLAAYGAPVALLVGVVGLSPAGLPPTPLAFALAGAALLLAGVALTLAVACVRRAPS
jgi:hypothetical protein